MNKLFFCYFFFIINFTFAQSNYYETLNNEFIKCKSNSKNNFEFCDCCNSSFKQLDIALNKVYKQTINRLPNDSLKIYYKKAQIRWINFANLIPPRNLFPAKPQHRGWKSILYKLTAIFDLCCCSPSLSDPNERLRQDDCDFSWNGRSFKLCGK